MCSSKNLSIIFLLFASLIMAGCGPDQLLGSTLKPINTSTPIPSATASITPTMIPSNTVTPSPTMTPTIEPPFQISDYLKNAQFTFYDTFDNLELDTWDAQSCQTISNGELEYSCTYGFIAREYTFHEGEGILIDFKSAEQDNDIFWGINFSHGEYGKDEWRNFGVSESENKYEMHLLKGTNWFGSHIYWIKPNIWYRLALAVGEDGRIIVLAWERDNPDAQVWKYRNTLGKDWSDLDWFFWVNNDQTVTLFFDNFYQIEFDEIN